MKKTLIFLLLVFGNLCTSFAQGGFTNWVTGDTADVQPDNFLPGIVLAGGGGDNDEAMQWMLERADGGDVLVIRASNSDGYNDYFFDQLGVQVNSVETIRFDNASAASDPYVAQQIMNAEVLFIAGGDQYDYYEYWKGTPIGDAINFCINEKGITVAGTSAGMAILGGAYYTPENLGTVTTEALANPYHPNLDIIGHGDFLNAPYLENTITDTHFDNRDRDGRFTTFLARLAKDYQVRPFGISCNEYTAVCIDENGKGTVFGEYPEYDDFAYFISVCENDSQPETCEADTPLTWYTNGLQLNVYKIPGTIDGVNYFNVDDWQDKSGGQWEAWNVVDGVLSKTELDEMPDCVMTATQSLKKEPSFLVFPNPTSSIVEIRTQQIGEIRSIILYNSIGTELIRQLPDLQNPIRLDLGKYSSGTYWIELITEKGSFTKKVVRI